MYFAYLSHSVPVHTGIKGRQVHPLIRFLLRRWVDEKCACHGYPAGSPSQGTKTNAQGQSQPGVDALRTLPSSSRRCRSRQKRSSTSCPGVIHRQPPLPPGPGLRLLVTVGALLCPLELLRPTLNRHLGRHVGPLAGLRCHPHPSRAPGYPGNQRSGPDVGNLEMLEFALSQETARTASLLPRRRAG